MRQIIAAVGSQKQLHIPHLRLKQEHSSIAVSLKTNKQTNKILTSDKIVEKLEPLYTLRNIKCYNWHEEHTDNSFKKIKQKTTIWSSNSIYGTYLKGLKTGF